MDNMFQGGVDSEQVHEATRIVLADVLGWRTSPKRWQHIAGLVAAVERAAADGDLVAVDTATDILERAVPVRGNRIERGPDDRVGIDDELRERVNRLQHSLGSGGRAAKEDADGRAGDADR